MLVALLNICNEEELKEQATDSPLNSQLTDGKVLLIILNFFIFFFFIIIIVGNKIIKK